MTGGLCDGYKPDDETKSQFPGYGTNLKVNGFVTPNGEMYIGAASMIIGRLGVVCVNVSVTPPKLCTSRPAFVELGEPGYGHGWDWNTWNLNFNSDAWLVGSTRTGRFFIMDNLYQYIVCFDVATRAKCAGPNSPWSFK